MAHRQETRSIKIIKSDESQRPTIWRRVLLQDAMTPKAMKDLCLLMERVRLWVVGDVDNRQRFRKPVIRQYTEMTDCNIPAKDLAR